MFYLFVALFCFYVAVRAARRRLLPLAVIFAVMGALLLIQPVFSFFHGA